MLTDQDEIVFEEFMGYGNKRRKLISDVYR
jgi:hypothetical protein